MKPELEKRLFTPNRTPDWVERHKDKLNKLVYKSLKSQNRLGDVSMQKMLFNSLSKDLRETIQKEELAKLQQSSSSTPASSPATASQPSPQTTLFLNGAVPAWIEKYRKEFNSMVYKSLKSQNKLIDANMQKMLFNSLSKDLQTKIKKDIEAAQKAAQASAPSASTTPVAATSPKLEALLSQTNALLSEIASILRELKTKL
ncbi:MAG: hypothetical protein D6805_00475 [Planctomycetota bacterium]|nr:MAG: hypothetical protein D6805_00475 [Planctomycetota bacterium]